MQDRNNICPCVWHHREVREDGHCKCHLFVGDNYSPETAYLPQEGSEKMVVASSIRKRSVTVYCTSWCPHSRRAKALLDRYQIPYLNIDIEADPTATKLVEEWNRGYRSVPTILFHLIVTEPSNSELEMILRNSQAVLVDLTVYVTDWCPDSRRTMAWLREHQINCTTINIEQDAAAAAQVKEWNNGFLSVPTLDMTLRLTEPASEQIETVLGLGVRG